MLELLQCFVMLAITSPAKSLDVSTEWHTDLTPTQSEFDTEVKELIAELQQLTPKQLQELFKVSENIARLNYNRFQSWDSLEQKPAILTYNGDIYKQFNASTFTETEQQYLQSHLRIISGLYGLLRPYDLIKPYRLEMGTNIKNLTLDSASLYEYWGDKLTQALNSKLQDFPEESRVVLNLASDEYVQAINQPNLSAELLNIEFRQMKDGEEKNYGIYAKKARGDFIAFMKNEKVRNLEDIKGFNYAGYQLKRTEPDGYVFVKDIE